MSQFCALLLNDERKRNLMFGQGEASLSVHVPCFYSPFLSHGLSEGNWVGGLTLGCHGSQLVSCQLKGLLDTMGHNGHAALREPLFRWLAQHHNGF